MKRCLLLLALCLPGLASATSVAPRPLEDLVRDADHIVVATVTAVEMVDGAGRPVEDPEARTGPGLENRMRFRLAVEDVLRTDDPALPRTLTVPLWSMWHYGLGAMREGVVGSRGVFLLRGKDFEPVYPTGFQRPLEERGRIERLAGARAP